jgi:hypothetical protein
MEIILIGAIVTVIVVFVIPLAVLRAGIRRQERAGCLGCRPPGLSTAIASRVAGLYVRQPAGDACPAARDRQGNDGSSLIPDDNESPAL